MRSPTPQTARRGPGRIRMGVVGLALYAAGAGCVCPPDASEVAATGYRTPEQTFRSFQVFLAADLVTEEFRCFSAGFRRRNGGLSLLTYGEFRDRLLSEKPWVRYLAKAEISAQEAVGEAEHFIDARIAGRTVRVKLVREDSYEISSGQDLLADGYAHFEDLVELDLRPQRPRITAAVTPDFLNGRPEDLARATRFVVERTWRIDDFWEADPQPPKLQP